MSLRVTIESTKWNQAVADLAAVLGKDQGEVLQDEVRLLLKQAIGFVPPKNQKQGRDAVKRDIMHAITPLDPDISFAGYNNKHVRETLQNLTRKKDWNALQVVFKRVPFKNKKDWRHVSVTSAVHNNAKMSRGRVRGYARQFTLERQPWAQYVKKIQGHVGRMKAAFGVAYQKVGGVLPSWISRHLSGARGAVQVNIFGDKSFVWLMNYAPGISEFERQFKDAMRARQSAIARRMRLILSGYSKDVARGIRVASRARRTN